MNLTTKKQQQLQNRATFFMYNSFQFFSVYVNFFTLNNRSMSVLLFHNGNDGAGKTPKEKKLDKQTKLAELS